ncbi:MAG: FkbM family methyltransferase [Pseudomonadales bacterium]|nr:FkbM family methyltransferase [Pseudomonadales bacterium]
MSATTKLCRFLWRQTWISLRWKKSIHRYLKEQGEPPDAPFVTDFFGMKYEGNLANGIEFAIYYYGAFEKPLLFFLRDTAKRIAAHSDRPIQFCDIGSNIGQHSLFMSRFAKTVHAFEPYEPVRARLQKHIELNNINNIEIHSLGLGEQDELKTFYAPKGSNQGIGSFTKDSIERGTEDIGRLQVVQGDSYFTACSIDSFQLCKLDVEGFEKPVLTGLQGTLKKQRPLIVCEVTYGESLSFQSREELLSVLPEHYHLYQFDKRNPDGQVARRRGSKAKRTGAYKLIPFNEWRQSEQDDIIAIPEELLDVVPFEGPDI